MRRFYAEPCYNIQWVFFKFAFVAVCFIRSDLWVNKTIFVRLYRAFYKTAGLALRFPDLPLRVPPRE